MPHRPSFAWRDISAIGLLIASIVSIGLLSAIAVGEGALVPPQVSISTGWIQLRASVQQQACRCEQRQSQCMASPMSPRRS